MQNWYEASPGIILGSRGLFNENAQTHAYLFNRMVYFDKSNFAYLYILTLSRHWYTGTTFYNVITSQQLGTSTHFLPCVTPHREESKPGTNHCALF